MKLKDIILKYVEDYKYQIKEHTYWIYVVMAKRMEDDLIIDETTPKNYLNEYLKNKKYSYSTKKMLKSLINRSLDFANKSGLLCYPYCVSLRLKQDKLRKPDALTHEEQKKIEAYIYQKKKPYYYGIIICLYTGIRLGELISLKWDNVDLKNNIITITNTTCFVAGHEIVDSAKTSCSVRQIPIAKNLRKIFLLLKEQNNIYVLQGNCNQKVCARSYQQTFNLILKKLKIKHHGFHSLRHTFASRLMENSVDVKTISELMGHATANITLSTYVHTSSNQKDYAVEKICA